MKQRIKQTIAALSLSLLSLSVQAATEVWTTLFLVILSRSNKPEKLKYLSFSATSAFIVTISIRFCCNTANLAKDVSLRTEHVVWMPEMLGLAKVAAAVNLSGLKYQANPVIFKAVYEQKINLANTNVFRSWVGKQTGFDSKKLLQAYNSPAAALAAAKMQQLTETYRIENTPTVIVGGKYKVNFNSTDWKAGMKTIDELIVKVRREQSSKPL